MEQNFKNSIIVKGARENNLKNVNIVLPKNKLIVMTGVSGSGKSSLAFDTIYAEGQRRYVESLSVYARQFLDNTKKPDVDLIEGLSPAIAIDQKTTSKNPRSTVGTITEIYDYLRLMYARIGKPICPVHNITITSQTIEQMTDTVLSYVEDTRISILSPVVENKKGSFDKIIEILKKEGYQKVLLDDQVYDLDEELDIDKNKKHTIFAIVDRLKVRKENRSRIYDSLESACKLSSGTAYVLENDNKHMFSEHYSCPICGFTIGKLEPTSFSFNSPLGACPTCKGLGFVTDFDVDRLITDDTISIKDGAIRYLKNLVNTENIEWQQYKILFDHYNIPIDIPYKMLSDAQKNIILYGSTEEIEYSITSSGGITFNKKKRIEGLAELIKRRYDETSSNMSKEYYASYLMECTCGTCHGMRLSENSLAVKVNGLNIIEFTNLSIIDAYDFINNMNLSKKDSSVAKLVINEIKSRLLFLKNVGLEYLTLSRSSGTLSGGEAQRIRLATQIGSNLTGVLYVLDEPSIGLHPSDNQKLIDSLKKMRDIGNTLIVVEHDEEIMRQCDYLVDVGRFAGVHGGEIIAYGEPEEFNKFENSITADFLSGRRKILIPKIRRTPSSDFIRIVNATENNLKGITVSFPKHIINLVTGVSGSGKSSLVNEILYNGLMKKIYRSKVHLGKCDRIEGIDDIDRVININQSPIGRTPRSNPATYTGVFDAIRDLFTETVEAKKRGYLKGRFSFNVKGGRCETCQGDGVLRISMNFLPDVYVECEACKGKRYNRETLEVKFRGKSIADVLDMTVEEAMDFFQNIPTIYPKMKTLYDVGLGYIKLGQSATTLSGGEAQRVKLASELYKKITPNTVFIFDEPTTGLHSYDIDKLLKIIGLIADQEATVIIIEHNLDVIKIADYIIDLGPKGGEMGGTVVATGTPEEVAESVDSLTAPFLKKILQSQN